MKQTAVEWLVANIDWQLLRNTKTHYKMIVEKAKEMEKQQIEQAFIEGYKARALASNLIFDQSSKLYAQQLFKKTFKSE